MIRRQLGDRLRRVYRGRAREFTAGELERPAIVVAPHFDDEVLGCGGTILRKIAAGASVAILFMTNGGRSHRHLMAPGELSRIRQAEARDAARVLGIPASAVHMLGFEEGNLTSNRDGVVESVCDAIRACSAQQVFYPYRADGNPDHEATAAIAARALRRIGRRFEVFEYPVWAWHVWPHCPVVVPGRRYIPSIVWAHVRTNLQLLRRLNVVSNVAGFGVGKQAALERYASQMTRLIDDPRWLTLSDVGSGEFLEVLLGEHEFFVRSVAGSESG